MRRCGCKRASSVRDLCDDELGVIFSLLDYEELFLMGWVCRRFRIASSSNHLWIPFVELPDNYVHGPRTMSYRDLFCQQNFPESMEKYRRLGRLNDYEIRYILSFQQSPQLFKMGFVSQRIREISSSDRLWDERRKEVGEYPKLIEKENSLEKEEDTNQIIPEHENGRAEYFYYASFQKRVEEKGVHELYKPLIGKFPRLKCYYYCSFILGPVFVALPTCLLFLCSLCWLGYLTLYLSLNGSEDMGTYGNIGCGVSIIICAILQGFSLCCNNWIHNSFFFYAKQIHSIPIPGTSHQKDILIELLTKKGVRGEKFIGRREEADFSREERLTRGVCFLSRFLGLAIIFIIFGLISHSADYVLMSIILSWFFFAVLVVLNIILDVPLHKRIFRLIASILCQTNHCDKNNPNYIFRGNTVKNLRKCFIADKGLKGFAFYFFFRLAILFVTILIFFAALYFSLGEFGYPLITFIWSLIFCMIWVGPLALLCRVVQILVVHGGEYRSVRQLMIESGQRVRGFVGGKNELFDVLDHFPSLDVCVWIGNYFLCVTLAASMVLFHILYANEKNNEMDEEEKYWVVAIPIMCFVAVMSLLSFVCVVGLWFARVYLPVDKKKMKQEYHPVVPIVMKDKEKQEEEN